MSTDNPSQFDTPQMVVHVPSVSGDATLPPGQSDAITAGHLHDTEPLSIEVSPAAIARRLTALVLVLAAVGAIVNIVIYQIAPSPDHRIARLLYRFDLGHEPSIPAWYSSVALLACCGLLALIGKFAGRTGRSFRWHWYALAVIFLLMAIDEAVMFHEMLDNALHQLLQTSGALYFSWVLPAIAFVGVLVICYRPFLWHLEPRTRWLFIAAGAIFVGGAVGMEMVAGLIHDSYGLESVAHTISQTIEETCEMLGIVLFIYALLDYLLRNVGTVRFSGPPATAIAAPSGETS